MVKRLVIIIFIVLLAIVSISLHGLWDRSNQYADVLYQHNTTPSQMPAQPLDTNGYTPISTDYEVRYEQDGGATPLITIAEAYKSNDGTESLYQLQFQLHFHDLENTPLTNRRATLKVYTQNFWEYEDGFVYGTYTTPSGNQHHVPLHTDAHFTNKDYTINANYYKNIDGDSYFLTSIEGALGVTLMQRETESFQLVFYSDDRADLLTSEQHISWRK